MAQRAGAPGQVVPQVRLLLLLLLLLLSVVL
jgi:hypothetical protein